MTHLAAWPFIVLGGAGVGVCMGLFGVGGSSVATPVLALLGAPVVGDTIHGQPRPGALLCHLPARRDEPLGAHAFAPRRRVPVAQHAGAAVQREEVVRIRVVEGTQPEASGVQPGRRSDAVAPQG